MEYSYSKPTSAPSYQSPPPARVSPGPASSFSGPRGGGGFMLPFLNPFQQTPQEEQPQEQVQEARAQNQAYNAQMNYGVNRQMNALQMPEQISKPNYTSNSMMIKNAPNIMNIQKDQTAKQSEQSEYSEGLKIRSELKKPDSIFGEARSDLLMDQVIDGGGTDRIPDAIFGESQVDRVQDAIFGENRSDELRWKTFDDVQLPDSSVSFQVRAQDSPARTVESSDVQQPLKTQGQMSFSDVQLPVYQAPAQAVQSQPSFWDSVRSGVGNFFDYANRYQQDKMAHPLREMALQTGASVLAAPALAALAPAAVATGVTSAAPIANNIVRLFPQGSQQVASSAMQNVGQSIAQSAPSNIVSFADYARQAGTLAAGVAGAVALPSAPQSIGWNPSKQPYSSQQVRGRRE